MNNLGIFSNCIKSKKQKILFQNHVYRTIHDTLYNNYTTLKTNKRQKKNYSYLHKHFIKKIMLEATNIFWPKQKKKPDFFYFHGFPFAVISITFLKTISISLQAFHSFSFQSISLNFRAIYLFLLESLVIFVKELACNCAEKIPLFPVAFTPKVIRVNSPQHHSG